MRVIAQVADTVRSLSGPSERYVLVEVIRALKLKEDREVNLVWFDSKLQDLTLPALLRPNYVNGADEKYYELISVSKVAEKYFEWIGNVSARERS